MNWEQYIGEALASLAALFIAVERYGPVVRRRINRKSEPPRSNSDIKELYGKTNTNSERITRNEKSIGALRISTDKMNDTLTCVDKKVGILLDRSER